MKTRLFINIQLLLISLFIFIFDANAHYGPRGLLGGTIVCATHFDNGIVAVGTELGGVFISNNNQLNGWRVRNVGLKSGKTKALFHNGSHLYVATADSGVYIFNGSAGGNDLFWNPRSNGIQNIPLLSLGGNADVILAGSAGMGLYRTFDGGMNWNAINFQSFNAQDIHAIGRAGNRLYVATDNAIFYSDDNSNTWLMLQDFQMQSIVGVKHFTYHEASDQMLVLANNSLILIDNASQAQLGLFSDATGQLNQGNIQIRHIANNDDSWFVATNQGIFHSPVQSPTNWQTMNAGLPTLDVNVVIAFNDNIVAGTNKLGVFNYPISQNTWSAINSGTHGISNIKAYSVAGRGDSLVVTATEYGIVVSNTLGFNPIIRNNGLTDSLNVNDVEFAEDYLLAATKNAGIFWSTNLGQTWQPINSGLSENNIIRVYFNNDEKFAIGESGRIYKSALHSTTWQTYDQGISASHKVSSLAFYGEFLYAGTFGGGVYKKHRDAASWSQFNSGLPAQNITAVAVSAGLLFAGTDGQGIFVTDFEQAAWNPTSPIFIEHFNDVPINPNHINYMTSFAGYLIASYRGGVVATVNGGASWIRGGHQFHLPSFSTINKISFINTRIKVVTEHNNMMSNSLNEFALIDTILTVSAGSVNAPAEGKRSYHTITSNIRWQISSSQPWVTVNVDSGFRNLNIFLDIAPNQGASRTATVTLTGGSITRTINVFQDGTLSVNHLAREEQIQVFPNPSSGLFHVSIPNPDEVLGMSLYHLNGKMITPLNYGRQNMNTFELKLPAGIYLLVIETRKGKVNHKIVIH